VDLTAGGLSLWASRPQDPSFREDPELSAFFLTGRPAPVGNPNRTFCLLCISPSGSPRRSFFFLRASYHLFDFSRKFSRSFLGLRRAVAPLSLIVFDLRSRFQRALPTAIRSLLFPYFHLLSIIALAQSFHPRDFDQLCSSPLPNLEAGVRRAAPSALPDFCVFSKSVGSQDDAADPSQ